MFGNQFQKLRSQIFKQQHQDAPKTPIKSLYDQLNNLYELQEEKPTQPAPKLPNPNYPQPNPQQIPMPTFHKCMELYTQNQNLKKNIEFLTKQIEKETTQSQNHMKLLKQKNQEISHWQKGYFDSTKNILEIEQQIAFVEDQLNDQRLKKVYQLPFSCLQPHKQILIKENQTTTENSVKCQTPVRKSINLSIEKVESAEVELRSSQKYRKVAPTATWQEIPPLFSTPASQQNSKKSTSRTNAIINKQKCRDNIRTNRIFTGSIKKPQNKKKNIHHEIPKTPQKINVKVNLQHNHRRVI